MALFCNVKIGVLRASGAVVGSLLLVVSTGVAAETLRLSSETSDATSRNMGAARFAQLVDTATQGQTQVKVFANAVLAGGDQLRQAEMVGRGDIDFVLSTAISVTPLIPEMAVFSLPYLYRNYAEVDATLQGEPARRMEQIMAEHGLVVLGWGESGFRELTNSVKPVSSPADLRGMKIRTASGISVRLIMGCLAFRRVELLWLVAGRLDERVVSGNWTMVVNTRAALSRFYPNRLIIIKIAFLFHSPFFVVLRYLSTSGVFKNSII